MGEGDGQGEGNGQGEGKGRGGGGPGEGKGRGMGRLLQDSFHERPLRLQGALGSAAATVNLDKLPFFPQLHPTPWGSSWRSPATWEGSSPQTQLTNTPTRRHSTSSRFMGMRGCTGCWVPFPPFRERESNRLRPDASTSTEGSPSSHGQRPGGGHGTERVGEHLGLGPATPSGTVLGCQAGDSEVQQPHARLCRPHPRAQASDPE